MEGYRNFCNKLWNAARFVLMNTEQDKFSNDQNHGALELPDRWILHALEQTIQRVHQHFANFRFDLIAQTLYEFIWNEYCDWYLELIKPILNSSAVTDSHKQHTRKILLHILENCLRLLHPIMPFITEDIWQQIAPKLTIDGPSIMLQPYPTSNKLYINQAAQDEIAWLKQIIIAIRNIRGEMNISPKKQLMVYMQKGSQNDRQYLENNKQYLMDLAKLTDIIWLNAYDTPPPAATALAGNIELLIPLAGLIDKQAEIIRLDKAINKLEAEQKKSLHKLNNKNYLDKAPQNIVEKEQNKLQQTQQALIKLQEQKQLMI